MQRVPEVLLEIKRRVDKDKGPGQFLLTGSANILTAPTVADALTGRVEYHRLWPLTQGEMLFAAETFLDELMDRGFPELGDQPIGRAPYAPLIAVGGFPASLSRSSRRRDAINFRTAQRYLELLETLFLIRRLPPYSSNLLARVTKTSKGYISDTGLLVSLIGANERRIESDDRIAGLCFETFAINELLRQAEWQTSRLAAFHYRDRDQREVDLVFEHADGRIVAIEVKAAASASTSDFKSLRYLRDRLGDRFVAGCLLYTGASVVPFGERLAAVPLAAIWGGFRE